MKIYLTFVALVTTILSQVLFFNKNLKIPSLLLNKNFSDFNVKPKWNLSYAPYSVNCPNHQIVRHANEVQNQYILNRNVKTEAVLKSLFYKNKIPNFDVEKFWINKTKPIKLAIALSGGGYRSMLTGAGILSSFDERELTKCNKLRGILQSTSYFAGISGGAWLVMSQFINDWKPITTMLGEWDLKQSLLKGISDVDKEQLEKKITKRNIFQLPNESITWFQRIFDSSEGSFLEYIKFYKELLIEVRDKRKAGFHVSLTDYWGRALARKLFTSTARTPGTTITAGTKQLDSFINHDQPFPIIGTIAKNPIDNITDPLVKLSSLDSQLFEFNAFEFGSWDNAFVDLEYLGSKLKNGTSQVIVNNSKLCISGFDNVGFLTATSSSLFNHMFKYLFNYIEKNQSETMVLLEDILKLFGFNHEWKLFNTPQQHPDHALYSPNPFWKFGKNQIAENLDLYLVDGGDDGQNIPFQPLIGKARGIDLILSYDVSGEFSNYPNGSVLQQTWKRFHTGTSVPTFKSPSGSIKSIFPRIPTSEEIITHRLNEKPIFLGCDVELDYEDLNTKNSKIYDYLPPLIMYQANSNYLYETNYSTFKLSYNEIEVNQMMENGFEIATFHNSSIYATCLNCFILKRDFDRIKYDIPKFCKACYQTYFGLTLLVLVLIFILHRTGSNAASLVHAQMSDQIPNKHHATSNNGPINNEPKKNKVDVSNNLVDSKNDEKTDDAINQEISKDKSEEGIKKPVTDKENTSESTEEYDPQTDLIKIRSLSPMTIFSKSYCPYSKNLKKLFEKYEIIPEPNIVELDLHEHGAELQTYLFEKSGRSTVPNVLVGSSFDSRGGSDDFEEYHKKNEIIQVLNDWGQGRLSVSKKDTPSNA
ncbi:SPO1 [Candida pseudojiufengensis]|uniref:SPO1 n=1 Tax=Candida pseudojiufengensis TaxID=497109 RepID=UPI002223EE33|nr:SPO1 [Candida pseudojiufengensis]KAI5964297.1 SPO1 [Candida pseudojiufengensis]